MPRVKIDYVVSFSSEDPEHPASNLLNREVSKKKWLCKKGESSCSVVLQLPRAVKISAVHIGAYHAALVEVLVARSETSTEQFQVLVPSSVLLSREESRRDVPVERVRSFSADQLAAARDQRWDRVRVVCSQPYNKHCKFGLSFVHIDECESSCAPAVPPRLLTLDALSSDEDDFKPGELFAKHMQNSTKEASATSTTNTGAQIRQATSQALKNIDESSTKLMKTPISKPSVRRDNTPSSERSDRSRDTLLYTTEDERPHDKIDATLQRHKEQKERDRRDRDKPSHSHKIKDEPKNTPKRTKVDTPPKNEPTPKRPNTNNDKPVSDHKKDIEVRKRRRSHSSEDEGPENPEPHTILKGVKLVLSGYENPLRAELRNTALALGAAVARDWAADCTHLICAFPNTPKLRTVRAGPGGARVPVARGDWLRACARRRRRLPWRWFATEQRHRVTPPPQVRDTPTRDHTDSGDDTDDEIDKVIKRRRVTDSNDTKQQGGSPASTSDGGPPAQAPAHDSDDAPTDEEPAPPPSPPPHGGALPDVFHGYTFAVDARPDDAALINRYIQAHGGLVLEMSALEEGSTVDYVVRGRGATGARATSKGATSVGATSRGATAAGATSKGVTVAPAAWLARCLRERKLLPHCA